MNRIFQILFSLFILLINVDSSAQNRGERYKDIDKYIPYNLSSYKRFPLKTINVKIHVIQFSKEEPMNLTLKDSAQLVRVINRELSYVYANLSSPTIKSKNYVPEIRDSRMRFKLKDILFHIDPILISSERLEENKKHGSPWDVDSINIETNEVWFKKYNANHFVKKRETMDSIIIYSSIDERSALNWDTVVWDTPYTKIKVRQSLIGLDIKKAANIKKIGTVCDPDLFEKYAIKDSTHLHIFITNSFISDNMGGCGPSALYMKVGNWNYKDGVKMTAHEIGHCMGLYHTNSPQFDDLPIKDVFGGPCDTIETSNNILGYNWCRDYLSPKQIGFIYKEYNTNPIKIKTSTDCTYEPKKPMIVKRNNTIDRNFVYGGDLIIKKKKILEISGKYSLPKGAHIYIEKKAKLIINGGLIHNACGDEWDGIIYIKKYKKKKSKLKLTKGAEQLIIKNGGQIENVAK